MSRSDFDVDLRFGQGFELLYREMFTGDDTTLEVKTSRIAHKDGVFFTELFCDKGRTGTFSPSGLQTTRSTHYVFHFFEPSIGVVMPTDLAYDVAAHYWKKDEWLPGGTNGNCPTQGAMVPLLAPDLIDFLNRRER